MRLLNKATGQFINVPTSRLAVALIRSDEYMFVNDDFKESEHPRDEDGKFTKGSGGGSSKSSGKLSLSSIESKAKSQKIDLQVHEGKEKITLALIKIPEKQRNKGLGKEYINELKEYANQVNKPIDLVPDDKQGKNVDYDRLVKFYEDLGFKLQEKGKPEKIGGFTKHQPDIYRYEPNSTTVSKSANQIKNSLQSVKELKNGGYIDHNGFEHSPNLTEAQRAVENGFYTEILKNTPKLIADYKAKFKNKIDPDDVKRLDPNFDKDSSLAAAVHEPSSYLSKVIWNQALKEKKEKGDTSPVLFTAGGSGSGKSEAGELAKAIIGAEEDPLTFDSVLGNFDKSTKKIDEALQAQDGKIDIVYTNAPLELAVLLNMKRSRTVKLDTQIEAHFAASENIRKLAEHYKNNDRVKITVVNNTGDPPDLAEGSLADVPTYSDREGIRKKLVAHAEHLVKNNLIKDKEGNLIPDPEKRLKLLLGN